MNTRSVHLKAVAHMPMTPLWWFDRPSRNWRWRRNRLLQVRYLHTKLTSRAMLDGGTDRIIDITSGLLTLPQVTRLPRHSLGRCVPCRYSAPPRAAMRTPGTCTASCPRAGRSPILFTRQLHSFAAPFALAICNRSFPANPAMEDSKQNQAGHATQRSNLHDNRSADIKRVGQL